MILRVPSQQRALLASMQAAAARASEQADALAQQLAGAARMTIQVLTENYDIPSGSSWEVAADFSYITLRTEDTDGETRLHHRSQDRDQHTDAGRNEPKGGSDLATSGRSGEGRASADPALSQ
jgi:hypothetical protein